MALLLSLFPASALSAPRGIVWSIGYDPATLDPAKVDDEASALVRYPTGGVLLRINRHTQEVEPSLPPPRILRRMAELSYSTCAVGYYFRRLRANTADVAASLQRVLDPSTEHRWQRSS